MHSTTCIIRMLTATVLVALPLAALPACDSGTPPPIDTKKVAKKVDPTVESKPVGPKPEVEPAAPKPEEKPAAVDPADNKIQLAALVAREISVAPDKADEILGKHGLDRDKLDAMMFEIAADEAMTRRYMEARSST